MADASYSDQLPLSSDDSRSNSTNQNPASSPSEQPTRQQALDRLQLITQAAQLYWWEWDLRTNQTTYSPNTEQIIGRPPAQSLQENLQLLHPDDRHLNQQALEQAQKEGTDSFHYQVRSIAIPSHIKYLQVSGQLYRDEQRQVVRVMGVTQDITARKLAELTLQENQQQQTYLLHLSDTLRTLADPMLIQQAAMQLLGEQLQVSRAFYGDMQADQDTLLIGPGYARDTFPLELQVRFSEFEADLTAYYGNGQTVVMDDVNDHPLVNDQSKAEFALIDCRAAVGVPLLKGGSVRAILSLHQRVPRPWTATEIALAQETAERTWAAVERAKAEETLRQREHRLQRMVNVPRVGVLTFDYAGQLLEANDAFLAMVGYDRAELAARAFTWRDFTPVEFVGESERMMQRLLTTMQGGPYEKEYFRKDGSRVWLMLVGANLGEGTIVEYAIDISDRKRAEHALRVADQRKDEFLAMLAHELRNPMSTLRSGLQILSITDGKDPIRSDTLAMMNRQTAHLVRLVDELLDVSRISQGKIELKRERLELGQVVAGALEAIRPQYIDAQKQLHFGPSSAELFINGDSTRLFQVVTNLVTNGLRYTGENGQVWVSLQAQPGEAVLRVADNGIGLTVDQLTAIFDLFVQADNSLARSQGGLGIGLTLVKRLVEMHGGRIMSNSAGIGQGSEFIVNLPLLEKPI